MVTKEGILYLNGYTKDKISLNLLYFFFSPNIASSKCFHKIENKIPCKPFDKIFVSNPLNIKPLTPFTARTSCKALGYPICSACVCLYTLSTRIELLHVSLTAELQNPKIARLPSFANCVSCSGIVSDKKLYVANHG